MSDRIVRGVKAPSLDVLFKCPNKNCEAEDVLDAFKGPPTCMGRREIIHPPEFMVAQKLITYQTGFPL